MCMFRFKIQIKKDSKTFFRKEIELTILEYRLYKNNRKK